MHHNRASPGYGYVNSLKVLRAWFRQVVGSLKAGIRRISIAALARKPLIAPWRYLEVGVVPVGATLKKV